MSDILHQPPNTMPRIEKLYAFVSVDEHGNEGVLAGPMGGFFMPLIAADPKRLKSIEPMAYAIAKESGMKVKLVEFTARVEIREINPGQH